MPQLKSLALSSSQQADMKALLHYHGKVERLDLSDCNLEDLPDYIFEQKQLTYLNLSGNPGMNWSRVLMKLAQMPRLKILNLACNGLNEIPAELYSLNLKKLILDENPIDGLADRTLFNLPESLRDLSLKNCGSVEVSPRLSGFRKLRRISLSEMNYDYLARINLFHERVEVNLN